MSTLAAMSSWKVLITARTMEQTGAAALDLIRGSGCEVVKPPKYGPLPAAELLPLLSEADAVLASMDHFTAEVLESPAAKRLKIISRWGVGYDAIDVPAATRQGVVVAYTPGLLNEAVADYAFSLMLAAARRVHEVHALLRQGHWRPLWGHDIFGKTLGIIGCGRIGMAMARRAQGFQMTLLGYDVSPNPEAERLGVQFVPLAELLSRSDFVSLHAALTPENRGLIGEKELRGMKPTAYLVNTARGALIEEEALLKALREKWIAGAALDAYAQEPLPSDHPLLSAPNVLLSPHQASFAQDTGERVSMAAAQAIVDLSQGRRPKWIVDPSVLDADNLRATLTS